MTDPAPHGLAAVRATLEGAASGLVYSSESDRPFAFFALPAPAAAAPLGAEQFARLVGAAPGTPVGERDLDAFFARHLELTDPYDTATQQLRPRYEALKAALRATLADVRVFRVGTIEVRCYVVGRTRDGTLAGLTTVAVET